MPAWEWSSLLISSRTVSHGDQICPPSQSLSPKPHPPSKHFRVTREKGNGRCALNYGDVLKEGNRTMFSSEFVAASPIGCPLQRPPSLFSLLEGREWALLSL